MPIIILYVLQIFIAGVGVAIAMTFLSEFENKKSILTAIATIVLVGAGFVWSSSARNNHQWYTIYCDVQEKMLGEQHIEYIAYKHNGSVCEVNLANKFGENIQEDDIIQVHIPRNLSQGIDMGKLPKYSLIHKTNPSYENAQNSINDIKVTEKIKDE